MDKITSQALGSQTKGKEEKTYNFGTTMKEYASTVPTLGNNITTTPETAKSPTAPVSATGRAKTSHWVRFRNAVLNFLIRSGEPFVSVEIATGHPEFIIGPNGVGHCSQEGRHKYDPREWTQ
jgi:hypothetical protein